MSAPLPEIAVLGCCMASPKAYWQVASLLAPEDFANGQTARLFDEIAARARAGHAFDAVTIGDARPDLQRLALDAYTTEGWRLGNVVGYAERVAANSLLRRLRQAGAQIAHLDSEDPYGAAQRLIAACAPRNQGKMRPLREYVSQSVEDLQRRFEHGEDISGLPTGLPELDAILGGMQPADLLILAARPSVGKTALALQKVRAVAKAGKGVAVFSLEMTGKKLNDRLTSAEGMLAGNLLRRPREMDESDWMRWGAANEQLATLPVWIDETPGITVEAIAARSRQLQAELANTPTPLAFIVIDYLQLIAKPKAATTNDAITIISAALKNLAKELNIPVLVLSQLKRTDENKRPTMADLRDSGSIEQDADVIMIIHRPSQKHRNFVELLMPKQREGDVCDLALEADYKYMRFVVTDRIPEGVNSDATTAVDDAWRGVMGGLEF